MEGRRCICFRQDDLGVTAVLTNLELSYEQLGTLARTVRPGDTNCELLTWKQWVKVWEGVTSLSARETGEKEWARALGDDQRRDEKRKKS